MLQPRSNPEHYDVLKREAQAAPARSILGRIRLKLRGMFRYSEASKPY